MSDAILQLPATMPRQDKRDPSRDVLGPHARLEANDKEAVVPGH